ncbi:MAG: 2-5 ligase [Solimicrobium sp.]|jgi:2'-5' RNA ligase|nr:2-5 ligase [Solimicrobium sp.]
MIKKTPKISDRTHRLFLALWPEATLQNAIKRLWDEGNWSTGAAQVPVESFHLTLHFLGNVPDSALSELVHGLKVAIHPFDLVFSRSCVWPQGVVMLEPDLVPDNLLKLHASLAEKIWNLGLSTEALAFRPHITLARHEIDTSLIYSLDKPIRWHVREYVLVKSEQTSKSKYHVLQTYY